MHSLDYSRYYVLAMNILRFFKVVIFDAVCHIETLASSTTILNIITVLISSPHIPAKTVVQNCTEKCEPYSKPIRDYKSQSNLESFTYESTYFHVIHELLIVAPTNDNVTLSLTTHLY